jgi:hypothetical protein
MYIISPKGIKEETENQSNLKGTYMSWPPLCTQNSHLLQTNYSLERWRYLMGLNRASCRAEGNVGRRFGDTVGLMSHPSTFFGTQTSNIFWPRTPRGSILGGYDSCCLSIRESDSLDSLWSFELGKKKWSLGLLATLLRLSFELAATLCTLHTQCAILYS